MALRLTRKAEGKEYGEILDLSGLIQRLGFPTSEYEPPAECSRTEVRKIEEQLRIDEVQYIVDTADQKEPVEISEKIVVDAIEEIKEKEKDLSNLKAEEINSIFDMTSDVTMAVRIGYEIFYRKYGFYYTEKEVELTAKPLIEMMEEIPEYRSRLMTVWKRNIKNKVIKGRFLKELRGLPEFMRDKVPYVYAYERKYQVQFEDTSGNVQKRFVFEQEVEEDNEIPF
jgi:hypothetical protein